MIEDKEIKIDENKFVIHQFMVMEAIKLEKKTLQILAPLLNIFKDVKNIDQEVNWGQLASSIQEILANVNDDELEEYIQKMFKNTHVYWKTDGGLQLISLLQKDIFNAVFIGKTINIYKLLLEIMKANNFAFFELWGGGGFLTGTLTGPKKNKNKLPVK